MAAKNQAGARQICDRLAMSVTGPAGDAGGCVPAIPELTLGREQGLAKGQGGTKASGPDPRGTGELRHALEEER